jgi:hypothetical protein
MNVTKALASPTAEYAACHSGDEQVHFVVARQIVCQHHGIRVLADVDELRTPRAAVNYCSVSSCI